MSNQLSKKRSNRKALILSAVVIFLALLAWYVNTHVSLEYFVIQEELFRAAIDLRPWRSFILGFGIYTVLALVPGTGGKAIVYGWLFGFWQAMAIVTVGLNLAAMAIFFLSRYLFQEYVEHRYTSFVSLMNSHIEKEGMFYLLMLRMVHAPFSIVNPVSGASRVQTWTFFWTTVVGLTPANAIWVYVGGRLPSLGELASRGAQAFIDLPLIAALVGCAALPLLIRWLVGRFGIPSADTEACISTTDQIQRPKL